VFRPRPEDQWTLYANDSAGVAAAAKADLTNAYNDAAGRPPGTTVNDLSGMVLAPGVYSSGSTMSIAVGDTLTLDAKGDAKRCLDLPGRVFAYREQQCSGAAD